MRLAPNEREQVKGIIKKWQAQYGTNKESMRSDKREILEGLEDLLDVEFSTKEDVERIIGNDAWIRPNECDECGNKSWEPMVEVGEELDYESKTATVCLECLLKAVELARSVQL